MLSAAIRPCPEAEGSRRPGCHTKPLMDSFLSFGGLLDLGHLATPISLNLTYAIIRIFLIHDR
jgi:hypothetical protein